MKRLCSIDNQPRCGHKIAPASGVKATTARCGAPGDVSPCAHQRLICIKTALWRNAWMPPCLVMPPMPTREAMPMHKHGALTKKHLQNGAPPRQTGKTCLSFMQAGQ